MNLRYITHYLFLFLIIFACQKQSEQKNTLAKDSISKENSKDSIPKSNISKSFETRLIHLGVYYKFCNEIFLDATDADFNQQCSECCNDNFRIKPKALVAIGIDTNYRLKGFSLNKLDNGLTVLGLSSNAELSTFMSFYLYDTNGKLIKKLFELNFGGDMGFVNSEYATCRNDTFSIHKMFFSPPQEDKCSFQYVNYNIYFDKKGDTRIDTVKKDCYKGQFNDIQKQKIKEFYITKKQHKLQIAEEEYNNVKKHFSF